jgi:hypothetical protein
MIRILFGEETLLVSAITVIFIKVTRSTFLGFYLIYIL